MPQTFYQSQSPRVFLNTDFAIERDGRRCKPPVWRASLFCALFVCSLLSSVDPVLGEEQVSVATSEWSPHASAPDSPTPGYMIEIAGAIFKKAGVKMNYQIMPWARALIAVKGGGLDGVVATDPESEPTLLFHKEPLGQYQDALIGPTSLAWKYEGVESLSKVTVGVEAEYGFAEDVNSYILKPGNDKVQTISSDDVPETALNMMDRKRIDLFYNDVSVFNWKIKQKGLDSSQYKAFHTFRAGSLFIGFSPKSPNAQKYADLLDKGIAEMRDSGELKTILDKYGLKDWKP